MKRSSVLMVCTVLFATTAQVMAMAEIKQITYVDANPDPVAGNVTVQGAPVVHPVNYPTIGAGENFYLDGGDASTGPAESDDGIWGERDLRATMNGDNVLVSKAAVDATDDGNGILWTSTPSLTAGKYYVYLFFWNNASGGGNWDCLAGLGEHSTMDTLTLYYKDNAVNLFGQTHLDGYKVPAGIKVDDGTQKLFGVRIGEVVLTEDGPITVSTAGTQRIDGGTDQRTWYDGIGYLKAENCTEVPAATVDGPIEPFATSVTVSGISPDAEKVDLAIDGGTSSVGSVTGNPPNTPSTMVVSVSAALTAGMKVDARQTIGGVQSCRVGPQTTVAWPPRITYVDAIPNTNGTDGNTTIDGALADFPNNAVTGSAAPTGHLTDGKWWFRTGRANENGGNVWETGNVETGLATLVTTLTLPPGTYNLYGLFWNDAQDTARWDVAFRVGTEGGFINYNGWMNASAVDPQNGTNTNQGGKEFVTPVSTRDVGFWLCMAPLGQYTVTDTIDIYVQAPLRPNVAAGDNQRTWYDGIGYELVSEPALPFECNDDDPPLCSFTDGFGDGDRENDGVLDNPDGSGAGVVDDALDVGLKWYKVDLDATHVQSAKVAPDIAAPAGLGTDNALHISAKENVYQVANFAPVSLKEPNEYIRLTFQWRMPQVVEFGDTFRFGLFHDGGTPVTSDHPVLDRVKDDPGYVMALATGTCCNPGHMAIGHPDHWWNGLPLNPSPLFGQDMWFGGQLPAPEPAFNGAINDTLPHKVELTITRFRPEYAPGVEGDRVYIDVSIDGGIASRATWTTSPASYEDRPPVLFFNEVAFGSAPAVGWFAGIDYIIDDVVIETGIYEPPCKDFVGDADGDEDVDMDDFAVFQRCIRPASIEQFSAECLCFDFDTDTDIDQVDLDVFAACGSGAGVKPNPACVPQP